MTNKELLKLMVSDYNSQLLDGEQPITEVDMIEQLRRKVDRGTWGSTTKRSKGNDFGNIQSLYIGDGIA